MRCSRGGAGPEYVLTETGPGAPDSQTLSPTVPQFVTLHSVVPADSTQWVTGGREVGVAPTATSSCLQNSSRQVHCKRRRERQKAKSMAPRAKVSFHKKWDA